MKNVMRLSLLALAAAALAACTSYVKTFDGSGTLIGSCSAKKGLLTGGAASCVGSANPKDQMTGR